MGRWSRGLAARLVSLVPLRAGATVLDVGCGTGALSFAVRDAVTSAAVTGIDPSPDYVAAAARKDPGIRFEVGDAQRLSFADDAFDATLSLLVLNFVPDRDRAVQEMIRVTKPGGTVAAAVWDYAEGMEMLRVFWDEAIALDPASAPRDEAHMPLTHDGELAAMWNRHGLEDVRALVLEWTLSFASFDDYWQPFLLGQGPAGAHVAALREDRRLALEQRLRTRLLGNAPDRPLELRARAWATSGTVPRRA